jgi:hypothetical protein
MLKQINEILNCLINQSQKIHIALLKVNNHRFKYLIKINSEKIKSKKNLINRWIIDRQNLKEI